MFLKKFTAKDGREVTLRTPKWEDLDDMLDFINSLVDEEAPIAIDNRVTREEEMGWLATRLTNLEKGNVAVIVAEVDGKMVGQVGVTPRFGRLRHVGNLGVSMKKGYRNIGIGGELMKEVEPQAKNLGIEIIHLEVFESNDNALHLYSKLGYREIGRIPQGAFYKGCYIDSVSMIKEIT
jgi:RimJ/RimL family protein N-acetyltransferase